MRIGTHSGRHRTLGQRLAEHYQAFSKERSIFRKNIGRALLARDQDPSLDVWDLDLTTPDAQQRARGRLRPLKQAGVEKRVSDNLAARTSFTVVSCEGNSKELRAWESGLIATVAQCAHCWASDSWLGHHSPKDRIRERSLWQTLQLDDTPLTAGEVDRFVSA